MGLNYSSEGHKPTRWLRRDLDQAKMLAFLRGVQESDWREKKIGKHRYRCVPAGNGWVIEREILGMFATPEWKAVIRVLYLGDVHEIMCTDFIEQEKLKVILQSFSSEFAAS